MKRTSLDLPECLPFQARLRARITDMNYGGHMGYDALVGILHEARIRYLESHGFTELDVGGASLMMVDAIVICQREIFAGAELTIDVGVADASRTSFNCFYRVLIGGVEHARAKTGMIFFDYELKKIQKMPQAFRDACVETSA
jgi:acyl-CoA thioesterase FadM